MVYSMNETVLSWWLTKPTVRKKAIWVERCVTALPNAFLWSDRNTDQPADRNTFYAFGAEEDEQGYMSKYGFEESIRDGATLPLHFEPRKLDLHITRMPSMPPMKN